MSIYYSQRTSTLQKVYATLEKVCSAHIAVTEYDCGDLQLFSTEYRFPLAYLETITEVGENQSKNGETYTVTLNLLDRQPEAHNRTTLVQTHDKLKQVFSEIKSYLERREVFGNVNVGPATLLLFNGFDDANLVRLRAEFTVSVDMVATDQPDLNLLFQF
ncbi:hypothetical protein [Hymenobacter siberiensis]|uniref:hypothetical protein n=1 Tax=Hymenobacter siberiensis TaxID=2848396 RepID=UPI001C1E78CE|nr:hypothetical protein [Hymenobacter siberiensis]